MSNKTTYYKENIMNNSTEKKTPLEKAMDQLAVDQVQLSVIDPLTYMSARSWQTKQESADVAKKRAIHMLIDDGCITEHGYSPYNEKTALDDQDTHIKYYNDLRIIAAMRLTEHDKKMLAYTQAEAGQLKGQLKKDHRSASEKHSRNMGHLRNAIKTELAARASGDTDGAGKPKRPAIEVFRGNIDKLEKRASTLFTEAQLGLLTDAFTSLRAAEPPIVEQDEIEH